jgi:hypothetical protein
MLSCQSMPTPGVFFKFDNDYSVLGLEGRLARCPAVRQGRNVGAEVIIRPLVYLNPKGPHRSGTPHFTSAQILHRVWLQDPPFTLATMDQSEILRRMQSRIHQGTFCSTCSWLFARVTCGIDDWSLNTSRTTPIDHSTRSFPSGKREPEFRHRNNLGGH